jgi:hypothetical protein
VHLNKCIIFRLRGKPNEPVQESGRNANYTLILPGYVENVNCLLSLQGYGQRNDDGVYLIADPHSCLGFESGCTAAHFIS